MSSRALAGKNGIGTRPLSRESGGHRPNFLFTSASKKSREDVNQMEPKTPSNRSTSPLGEEEKKIYAEFTSAETYIRTFVKEREFDQVVAGRKKLINVINTLHAASSKLITTSIIAFTQLRIDYRLWDVSVYQIVKLGRHATTNNPSNKSEIRKVVNFFLEKGVKHLEELMAAVKTKYPYTTNFINGGADYSAFPPAEAEAAATCLPRLLISLGDSLRYLGLLPLSLEAYEQARSIDPGNGRALHQLGLIALIQRDFLSAVYDFFRAYSSPAPIPLEAFKPQLQIAFDEALKDYNRVSSSFWYQTGKRAESKVAEDAEREIWIFAHGFETVPRFPVEVDTKESHWKKFSPLELFHRFCISYVLVIEKLWMNVGMDTIHVVAEESLIYLEGLLQRGAVFLPLRIIQVLSINMLLLDKLRPLGSSDSTWITAIQFAMEVCTILTERLARLIDLCDWDTTQMETIAVGLSTWIHWMEKHQKDWTPRRPRPAFAIKHVTRPKDEVLKERLDDSWTSFASLMTKLAVVFERFSSSLFPSVISTEDDQHKIPLAPFPEAKHLFGLLPMATSYVFRHKYFCGSKLRLTTARNYVRVKNIFRFGALVLEEKYGILEVQRLDGGTHTFLTRVRVKSAYTEREIGGLDTCHYHYWLQSFVSHVEEADKPQRPKRGDVNNACRTIVRHRKSLPEESSTVAATAPIPPKVLVHQRTLKIWEYFAKEGFQTDIIIEPIHFVLDTNCFVRRLDMVKLLMTLTTRPLFIPVSVILELKGLARGGLRKKDQVRYGEDTRNADAQQKMLDGMILGDLCQVALDYITDNISYFRILTSTAVVLQVKTPHAFIQDKYFDPSDNNDNRILQSCRELQDQDYISKQKDTTRRIHRRTVLVSDDRGLRIRSSCCYYIPSCAIIALVAWLLCHHSTEFYESMRRSLSDGKRMQYQRQKEIRADKKALRNPLSPEPKLLRILQNPSPPTLLKDSP